MALSPLEKPSVGLADIEDGDESVFMIIGVAGRGEMSAQPMVVENSEVLFPPRVNLHFCCVTDYVLGKETEPQ